MADPKRDGGAVAAAMDDDDGDDGGDDDWGGATLQDSAHVVHDKPLTEKEKKRREGKDTRDSVDTKTAWTYFTPILQQTVGKVQPVADDGWCWWHAVAHGLNALQVPAWRAPGALPVPQRLAGQWTAQSLRAAELSCSEREVSEAVAGGSAKGELTAAAFVESLTSDDKAKRWGDPQIDGRLLTALLNFSLLTVTLRMEKDNGECSVYFELVSGPKGQKPIRVCEDVVVVVQYEQHVNACTPNSQYVGNALCHMLSGSNSGRYVEGPSSIAFKIAVDEFRPELNRAMAASKAVFQERHEKALKEAAAVAAVIKRLSTVVTVPELIAAVQRELNILRPPPPHMLMWEELGLGRLCIPPGSRPIETQSGIAIRLHDGRLIDPRRFVLRKDEEWKPWADRMRERDGKRGDGKRGAGSAGGGDYEGGGRFDEFDDGHYGPMRGGDPLEDEYRRRTGRPYDRDGDPRDFRDHDMRGGRRHHGHGMAPWEPHMGDPRNHPDWADPRFRQYIHRMMRGGGRGFGGGFGGGGGGRHQPRGFRDDRDRDDLYGHDRDRDFGGGRPPRAWEDERDRDGDRDMGVGMAGMYDGDAAGDWPRPNRGGAAAAAAAGGHGGQRLPQMPGAGGAGGAAPPAMVYKAWKCAVCTYDNPDGERKCKMCTTDAPASAHVPVGQAAARAGGAAAAAAGGASAAAAAAGASAPLPKVRTAEFLKRFLKAEAIEGVLKNADNVTAKDLVAAGFQVMQHKVSAPKLAEAIKTNSAANIIRDLT